jgi:hypothetical protein
MIASAFDRASYLPAVADAVVGYDGSVWLAEPQEVEGVTWRRFWPASDPEKSQLYLPFRSRVLEADRDGVYAVVEGEFGVQYLSRFLLPRR